MKTYRANFQVADHDLVSGFCSGVLLFGDSINDATKYNDIHIYAVAPDGDISVKKGDTIKSVLIATAKVDFTSVVLQD